MALVRHLTSPSPWPSPSPPTGLSLVCRLVVVLTPPPLVLSTLPLPQPLPMTPLFPLASVCWLVVTSPLVAPPLPCINFRCTAASRLHPVPLLFVHAGWLSRRILSHRLRFSTRRRLTYCLLRHLCFTSASLPSLAPPFSLPPLSTERPSPASSNAGHTLLVLVAALPTSTAPSRSCLVLRHVRPRRRIFLFAFANEGRVQRKKIVITS